MKTSDGIIGAIKKTAQEYLPDAEILLFRSPWEKIRDNDLHKSLAEKKAARENIK